MEGRYKTVLWNRFLDTYMETFMEQFLEIFAWRHYGAILAIHRNFKENVYIYFFNEKL